MPHRPFGFGGTQQLVKEWYPGNREPTVQVMGSRESDVTLKGRLKVKKIKDTSARTLVADYQEAIDDLRRRGNLLQIRLGEWVRYGFIEEAGFQLNRLVDIEYDIKLVIVGHRPPANYKFTDKADDDIGRPTAELAKQASEAFDTATTFPSEMPQSVADIIDSGVNSVASAIRLVTGFIDGVVSDAQDIVRSANRAVGLIKNARATISRTGRNVAAISMDISTLGSSVTGESNKAVAQIKSIDHINKVQTGNVSLMALLAQLQRKFAAMAATIPMVRHLVKDGDTLQRLAMKYYNNGDLWKKIYDHNKLQSTALERGTVLEIPRL
jgi:nucleoid-associated protein YgaU